ncbi:MAG TPA: spermidine synthase [Thermoanaerobaculia bacterium]|nr:spermidine synthase [Thermoanaerobaculia bacterium]
MDTSHTVLASVPTREGLLELRRQPGDAFEITLGGRVLHSSGSGLGRALGELAAHQLGDLPAPRVLLGGLALGLTLRALLDALPAAARVTAAEPSPEAVAWCRGPLAELNRGAVSDPRVEVATAEIADVIQIASAPAADRYDAILLDLTAVVAPAGQTPERHTSSRRALETAHRALTAEGLLAVAAGGADPGLERRLAAAGFRVERRHPPVDDQESVVYLARRIARSED